MDYYLGTIIPWLLPWAPMNFKMCNGQELNISEYNSLFSLIGTTYGGDGINKFALPNLNGRFMVGAGLQPGGHDYILGEMSGTEQVTLVGENMPSHNHNLTVQVKKKCSNGQGTQSASPKSHVVSRSSSSSVTPYSASAVENSYTGGYNIIVNEANQGGGLPHDNMPPFRTISFIICVAGIWPDRP